MAYNQPNDPFLPTNMSAQDWLDNNRFHVEAPAFHPKLARSDTTVAEAGSPSPPSNKSVSCPNCSFPLPESVFDTAGDPAQLSHYFPLPPTKVDATPASAKFLSDPSPHNTSMKSPDESTSQASLQETLDALWAPPKHVPVRISAPVSPTGKTDEPLIDFSDQIPTTPSFLTCSTTSALISSGDTSFEVKTSGGYQSGDSSPAFEVNVNVKTGGEHHHIGGVPMCREETLTQMATRQPDWNLEPKQANNAAQFDSVRRRGSEFSFGEDEPVLVPYTYADAANIANKYPELAAKVLKEPLATPVQATIALEPEEEPGEQFVAPQEPQITAKPDPVPVMPEHTRDSPNWALAPDDDPEYQDCRPRRDRDRRDFGRRESAGFAQNQNDFDDQWQGGGGDRSQRNTSQRYSRGYDEQGGDRSNARSGNGGRGWSQEPSYSANDRSHDRTHDVPPHLRANDRSHDVPPHLRGNANDSYDQSYRLPTRPSATRMDSLNAAAPVEESAPAADPWTPTHDPWTAAAAPAEKPAETRPQASDAEAGDDWTPKHDPWGVPVEQPAPAARSVPHSQTTPSSQSHRLPETNGRDETAFHAPRKEESRAVAPSVDPWVASHDPWAVADENQSQQPQMLEPPKRDTPSTVRGGGSPFRDRMNDNTNQNDRSVNEAPFSTNVLDVRAPSQANVAALAATRAEEVYDRRGPDNNRSKSQEDELPAEFNYFMHSETVDWTSPAPTKATQNSFSPSQNLATPPTSATTISAPTPRPTNYFDYNQQPTDNFATPAVPEDTFKPPAPALAPAPAARENDSSTVDLPSSNSYVLGSMKTDRYVDEGHKGRDRSASQWGPERSDGGRGRGRDSASPAHGGGPRGDDYGRQDDYRGRDDDRGRRGGDYGRDDDRGRRGDDYGRDDDRGRRGDDYGRREDDRGRRDDDYGRDDNRGRRDDYGHLDYDRGRRDDDFSRRGDDHDRRGDDYGCRDDYGRREDDRGRRVEDYSRRGDDDRRGDDHGRRGGDDFGRRADNHASVSPHASRGGSPYSSASARGGMASVRGGKGLGHPAVQASLFANSRGGYGSLGPLPPKYSGPPRLTSYGAGANFVLPPLDEY